MSSLLESSHTRIGRRIRELRMQNSLSRSELAGKARLQAGYISRLEDGQEIPDCDTLRVLAGALSVPVYRLFCAGEDPLSTPRQTPRPSLDEQVVEVPLSPAIRGRRLEPGRVRIVRVHMSPSKQTPDRMGETWPNFKESDPPAAGRMGLPPDRPA